MHRDLWRIKGKVLVSFQRPTLSTIHVYMIFIPRFLIYKYSNQILSPFLIYSLLAGCTVLCYNFCFSKACFCSKEQKAVYMGSYTTVYGKLSDSGVLRRAEESRFNKNRELIILSFVLPSLLFLYKESLLFYNIAITVFL